MSEPFYARIRTELARIDAEGLGKPERVLAAPQGVETLVRDARGDPRAVLNFCANNYLGLAGDARVREAAARAARDHGAGLASVRFICGTQEIHKELEAEIAAYLGFEDAVLFASCFDANAAVFEPLLGEGDAIVSDSLNHASIIDGVRLCKARRYRYASGDMNDLEAQLVQARSDGAQAILIATDGVFSMDGKYAPLGDIRRLAERFDALVMVDDCHATGHLGPGGRGTPAMFDAPGEVAIVTGTFGKTLSGAMGGFIAARREVADLIRQRARPYLFSNTLAPSVCGGALEAIRIARSPEGDELRGRLARATQRFRSGIEDIGLPVLEGTTPIVPVMFGDARAAQLAAARLFEAGLLVTGFSFPVVPKGLARIRVQLSALHSDEHIDAALRAFAAVAAPLLEETDGRI
ncbi:glycine C-acetyltransferase [Caulobacter mirabilis]|uniref:5-aminolevulinate synthase n=1 Tax=Caulobacter mirabilis TaxID=69666 RepID=A0A2D2AZF0_9CAUL|nr:glycine C-acetyltransferase [Caulobacter mirabilis]ATQ43373.1 glycine C-acetyltransferase [Caulobacter mirabilis]